MLLLTKADCLEPTPRRAAQHCAVRVKAVARTAEVFEQRGDEITASLLLLLLGIMPLPLLVAVGCST